jgi:hypothetical protein
MNTLQSSRNGMGAGIQALWRDLVRGRGLNRGAAWGMIIVGALAAFEIFNFSTTQFALRDVLGDLTFGAFRWATILAIAFCGIDFAGIARIFTPQQGRDEPAEVWYLFGAWLLAAGFNATLTWWGVSVAIVNHASSAGAAVIGSQTLTKVVPVFVAVMVWLIRVLIIGTFSVAGDKLFSTAQGGRQNARSYPSQASRPLVSQAAGLRSASSPSRPVAPAYRPAPKPSSPLGRDVAEPTYHPVPFDASAASDASGGQRLQ